jgi:hypothetical protein
MNGSGTYTSTGPNGRPGGYQMLSGRNGGEVLSSEQY